MTYDDADRLTSVIQKNPLTGDNVKKMEYEYDGLSRRRVSTTYTWNAGTQTWTQQDERHFIYDGMDLIQERDGSNTVIASYVRDGNIGGVLSRTTSSGTFYYHYDGNGNVVAMTNISGAIVAQYTYDAYGNLTSMSGAEAASNPIRFSTKYFDTNTGYYDFGFRSYDPVTGRWLNRDPIGESGGLNLYGFVGNSPGNAVDAYGLADRKGDKAGQVINDSKSYVLSLFDTEANVTGRAVVWQLWIPPGYETNPAHADIDYVGGAGGVWRHLLPNGNGAKGGGIFACRFWNNSWGTTSSFPGVATFPFHVPEWLRFGKNTPILNQTRPLTEGIDPKTGLPQDLVGGRPLRTMPFSMAKGWGFIRKIK